MVRLYSVTSVLALVIALSACMREGERPGAKESASRAATRPPAAAVTGTDNWMRDYVQARVWAKTFEFVPRAKRANLMPRIVGGGPAGPEDNPFQVGLLNASIANTMVAQFCGGSLVHDNLVVTAAHCSDFINDVGDVEVLTDTRLLDGTGQRRGVARIAIHPDWDSSTFDHDAAVWELTTNAAGTTLATLATADGTVGGGLLATGWGATFEGGASPIRLMRVEVPLVARGNCNDANSYDGDITDSMLCAGLDGGGRDACQGDSGGPLTRGTGNRVLTGITSWGIGCARPNLYGVYTRVSRESVRSFIQSGGSFVRRGTATAGAISDVSTAALANGRFVTAMRDGSNDLRLISWDVASDGTITRRETATAGTIGEVSLASLNSGRFVTAMRDGSNDLRLISWDVASDGTITRRETATAGTIGEVSLVALSSSRVVAAIRDGSSNLRLIVWDVAGDGGMIRRGTARAGRISLVSLLPLGSSRVVAAMRDGSGGLRLITWDLDVSGNLTRRGDETAGAVSKLSLSALSPGRLVVAVRDGTGNLRLLSWDVATNGTLTRRGTATAGEISEVAIARLTVGRVVSSMRDGSGDLRLIAWDVAADGSMNRRGTATAGPISRIGSTALSGTRMLASMRDGSGELRLVAWDVAPP